MKQISATIYFVLISFFSFAQSVTFLNQYQHQIWDTQKYPPTYFRIDKVDSANLIQKVFTLDSLLVQESVSRKNDVGNWILASESKFFENGEKEYEYTFEQTNGEKKTLYYHENGVLYSSILKNGETIISESYFDEEGTPREKPVDEDPSPHGGLEGWFGYLSDNLKYPREARRNGFEGVLIIAFVVNEEGKLEELNAVNPEEIHPLLLEEGLRVVQDYPFLWTPGKRDGKNVRVLMKLPLKFSLSGR
ncbi:TonB [Mariniradius saccharolyticus AK6]|uniref:TonB n=1 Tax=Mariniradius saccharolyticus AK6 TaxID=1239962 RepID=M7YCH4_9BACT|nr:energy transducer TonB [Mariniradius saccharolyticus]EMS34856.1 TonB [Mariniradius saccharolyticus AK6]